MCVGALGTAATQAQASVTIQGYSPAWPSGPFLQKKPHPVRATNLQPHWIEELFFLKCKWNALPFPPDPSLEKRKWAGLGWGETISQRRN